MHLLSAAHPIVVHVPSADGGVSIESILVFLGGTIAAIAAIASALLTSRGASSRLETSLLSERERSKQQLAAERERSEQQLAHERFLAQRAEASASVEQISRVVARSNARVAGLVSTLLRGDEPAKSELESLNGHLDELREEVNVLALRFGTQSPIVYAMLGVVKAAKDAIPSAEELPLSEEAKEKFKEARKATGQANSKFIIEAKNTIENYGLA